MRRIVTLFVAVFLLCCLLGGCGFWMAGEHLSVTPHEDQWGITADTTVMVTSYAQLRNTLHDTVKSCAEKSIISISSFSNATLDYYVSSAINHVMKSTAVGAYAVDNITYEIGTKRGSSVVAFDITYRHSRADILGMLQAGNSDETVKAITNALEQHEARVVIHTENYESMDYTQLVQVYANDHPNLVAEVPQVSFFVYPERGSERIIELNFGYMTDREALREMQTRVAEVFTSAELYVKDTTKVKDIYSRLYSFLMERNSDYTIETSITPAYSLLQHGVGDSKAFANVYAAMCRGAELDCTVVSGTRDAEPWCWNLVRYRGKYYHIDLLRCNENGQFTMHSPDEMIGYVWDYSAYPSS